MQACTSTGVRSEYGVCGWRDEDLAGIIERGVCGRWGAQGLSNMYGEDGGGPCHCGRVANRKSTRFDKNQSHSTRGSTHRCTFHRSATMPGPGYQNHKEHIVLKIRSLLIHLTNEPSEYDEIAPKIEYWIEYVLREGFSTIDDLVEGVSYVAWDGGGSFASVGKFFKEFRDAPHRSEQARTFVTRMCPHVLRWFAIASAESFGGHPRESISSDEGPGFVRAASFVGHLIQFGLLSHELVQRHLIKPLTSHHGHYERRNSPDAFRAQGIHQLFTAAGNTLLQGLLEPDDAQVCFDILDLWRDYGWFDAANVKVQYTTHADASLGA